jgi:phage terminase large subunit-like protein
MLMKLAWKRTIGPSAERPKQTYPRMSASGRKGKARLAGSFPELEDELARLTCAGFEGRGASPDRADAMVWAMSELFERPRAQPRVRSL